MRVSRFPDPRRFGLVAAVLLVGLAVDLLVSQSAATVVLVLRVVGLIALPAFRDAREAPVPDATTAKALNGAQIAAIALAFVAGAFADDDDYFTVAVLTFVGASLVLWFLVATWANRRLAR